MEGFRAFMLMFDCHVYSGPKHPRNRIKCCIIELIGQGMRVKAPRWRIYVSKIEYLMHVYT
jgi:hypothetical protein